MVVLTSGQKVGIGLGLVALLGYLTLRAKAEECVEGSIEYLVCVNPATGETTTVIQSPRTMPPENSIAIRECHDGKWVELNPNVPFSWCQPVIPECTEGEEQYTTCANPTSSNYRQNTPVKRCINNKWENVIIPSDWCISTCTLGGEAYNEATGECYCTDQRIPVCGVDGVTYENECQATKKYGVEIAYEGECISGWKTPLPYDVPKDEMLVKCTPGTYNLSDGTIMIISGPPYIFHFSNPNYPRIYLKAITGNTAYGAPEAYMVTDVAFPWSGYGGALYEYTTGIDPAYLCIVEHNETACHIGAPGDVKNSIQALDINSYSWLCAYLTFLRGFMLSNICMECSPNGMLACREGSDTVWGCGNGIWGDTCQTYWEQPPGPIYCGRPCTEGDQKCICGKEHQCIGGRWIVINSYTCW